jgi:hypothetical protein
MKVANRGKSHQWEGRVRTGGSYVEGEGLGSRLGQEGRVEGGESSRERGTRARYFGYAQEEEPARDLFPMSTKERRVSIKRGRKKSRLLGPWSAWSV